MLCNPFRIVYVSSLQSINDIHQLFDELGISKTPQLSLTSAEANTVIWPKQFDGQPLFKLIDRRRGPRLWHRILDYFMPQKEHVLSDEIESYVQRLRPPSAQ